jgi:tetratricopeptide (TPR) repeat protein
LGILYLASYVLATFFANRGLHYQIRGLWDKAEQDFLEAARIVEHLTAAHAGVADYPIALGEFYGDLGELLLTTGKAQAALDWYGKAIAQLQPILKQAPKDSRANYQLIRMHEGTARSLARLSKYAEALQAWERAIQLAKGPLQDGFRVGRAVTLARMHEPARATGDLEDLLNKECSAATLYNAACVFALSAATPALEPERADQYAARAVELLRKATEKGFHNVEAMKRDTDLLSLHQRADFTQLLVDLEKKTLPTPKRQN